MQDIFSMKGKCVVFTGGAGNLGRAMVTCLLEYGADVVVPIRTDRFGAEFDAWRSSGQLAVIKADLSSTDETRAFFAKAYELHSRIDVLVNCAAYGGGAGGHSCEYRLDKIDDETWNRGIDGTLGVIFRCTREAIPYFEKCGGGNIVNVSSMYGMTAPDFAIYGENIPWSPPTYGSGKAGVIQFTRYCASALASKKIRVNCLTPGPFPTITPASDQAFMQRLSNKTMMKRTGRAEELNGALMLLCSDASTFMTAANIVVDGGMTQF